MLRTKGNALPVLLVVLIVSIVSITSCVAGLQRPLTTKEKVYQAGGVLLGLGQELEAAIKSGLIKGDAASKVILTYDAATQVYRQAAALAIQGKETDALAVYQQVLAATRTILDALTKAGVKL